jgi:hypothetical protein
MNLKSSRIRSVNYSKSTETLIIDFIKGGVYKYFSVPETVYNGILKSSSPGNYFDTFIKTKYKYKKG